MEHNHKYAEAIIAWVNGKTIQFRRSNSEDWKDFKYPFENYKGCGEPSFNSSNCEWRVKPCRWYRVYECNDLSIGVTSSNTLEAWVVTSCYFKRWITERIYLD